MICNFTITMLHYPEIMRKAQVELDKVVGRERAPNFEDKNNLPYVPSNRSGNITVASGSTFRLASHDRI